MCVCIYIYMLSCFSHVRVFVTPWTVAHQAPLSMGFSRQEYWRGLPCSPPGDLSIYLYIWSHLVAHRILVPPPAMEPVSPAVEA